jgi:hypothetical protein
MYKLLQNQSVSKFHNEINDLGWGEAAEKYPAVDAYLKTRTGADRFTLDMTVHYTHVADIDANTLEDAFFIHNNPHGDEILEAQITRHTNQHSMSVGDLLIEESGRIYICDTFGFTYVGDEFEAGIERAMKEAV